MNNPLTTSQQESLKAFQQDWQSLQTTIQNAGKQSSDTFENIGRDIHDLTSQITQNGNNIRDIFQQWSHDMAHSLIHNTTNGLLDSLLAQLPEQLLTTKNHPTHMTENRYAPNINVHIAGHTPQGLQQQSRRQIASMLARITERGKGFF